MAKGAPKDTGNKNATKIIRCSCVHEYQDQRYGKGMRVHNPSSGTVVKYSCTVCGSTK